MKSVIEEVTEKERSLNYPVLMIDKQDGMIVLVTEKEGDHYKGIILHKGINPSSSMDLQVGSFNGSLGSSYFEPFKGELRLSNN